MSESCHHNLPCSCPNPSETIDNVKNKLESCIREYMSFDETVTCLQEKHKINHHLTKIIWKQLERESPEFFKNYHLKLEMTRHIKMFNGLLAKQVAMMIEYGEHNICSGSSAIVNFLSQDPEGTRLLERLAKPPAYPELSPSSLPLTESNGPTVNQLQIPNDQQNQVHHYQWSTPNGFTDNHLGAPTAAPALTDQCFTSNGLACNYPAASTVAPVTTAQWSPSNNPAYIGASTVAQAATMPLDPSTFGGNIGFKGLNFTDTDLEQLVMQFQNQLNGQYLPQLQLPDFPQQEQQPLQYGVSNNGIQHGGNNIVVMQSENQLQDLYGQYQPQLQLQQPFLLEEPPRLQYGVSNSELQYGGNNNSLQNGGSNNGIQQRGNNIVVMQSENQLQELYGQYQPQLQLQQPFLLEEPPRLQYGVSNSELQYGGNNNSLQNGGSNNGIQQRGNNIVVMQSENQLQDLYEQYQPQLQLQQPFLLEEPPRLQYGVSNSELQYGGNNNSLQNGGSNNGIQQRGNNIVVMQSENQLQDLYGQYLPQLQLEQPFLLEPQTTVQYGGTNNWLQNGGSNNGLLGAIPESAGFNNPSNGNGTLTMAPIQLGQGSL